jgi:hypothetical protein
MNDTFYEGLTIGILTGITLNVIKNYIFKNKYINRDTTKLDVTDEEIRSEYKSSTNENEEFKIALLVRHDLKMGKGKIAAQVRYTYKYILIVNILLFMILFENILFEMKNDNYLV